MDKHTHKKRTIVDTTTEPIWTDTPLKDAADPDVPFERVESFAPVKAGRALTPGEQGEETIRQALKEKAANSAHIS